MAGYRRIATVARPRRALVRAHRQRQDARRVHVGDKQARARRRKRRADRRSLGALRLAAQGARQRYTSKSRRAAVRGQGGRVGTRAEARGDSRGTSHRRHAGGRADGDAEAATADPGHDARIAVHPADLAAFSREAACGPLRDCRRTSCGRGQQARRASDGHARAARTDGAAGWGAAPARIGLSATLNPIETLAAFLAGAEVDDHGERHPRPVRIVRADDSVRALDLKIIAPGPELGALATHQHWEAMYDALASLIRDHRTTLIFTLSRRWAERIALALQKRVGADAVMAHHGVSRARNGLWPSNGS